MSSCPAHLSALESLSLPILTIVTCVCLLLFGMLGFLLASKNRQMSNSHAVVRDLFIYPIKGCAGIRVSSAVVTPRGLAHDRMLMIVRELDGAFQTLRQLPQMATIRPFWNESEELVLTAPECPDFVLSTEVNEDGAQCRAARVWKHVVPDAIDCGDAVAAWLSKALSTTGLRLVRMPQSHQRPVKDDTDGQSVLSFADGFPLLLSSEKSRDEIRKKAGLPKLIMQRFRPNIVVDGGNLKPFEEHQWGNVVVGNARFNAPKLCRRCQVPRVDPATGIPDSLPNRQPTTELMSLTRNHFGVYLVPINPGVSTVRVGDFVRVCHRDK